MLWARVSEIRMATENAVRKGLQENGRGVFQALSWRDSAKSRKRSQDIRSVGRVQTLSFPNSSVHYFI